MGTSVREGMAYAEDPGDDEGKKVESRVGTLQCISLILNVLDLERVRAET